MNQSTNTLTAVAVAIGATTAVAAGFDLADFEDVLSTQVTIKNPVTGAPTGFVVEVAGPEHPARKRIVFARQRRIRSALQKTGKLALDDPEEDEANDTEMLVASVLGWSGLVVNGAELPYSADAAKALLTDPKRRWLRDQLKAALDEREAFISRSVAG